MTFLLPEYIFDRASHTFVDDAATTLAGNLATIVGSIKRNGVADPARFELAGNLAARRGDSLACCGEGANAYVEAHRRLMGLILCVVHVRERRERCVGRSCEHKSKCSVSQASPRV
jgi:hypothetical protein